jgi:XTP/dITP diphosphohydrolase
MKLIFASNNQHKIDELKTIIPPGYEILTLKDAGIDIEIPEPYDTLEANAQEKAEVIHRLTGDNCFSEDTGLEIDALNGEPGVHSARYAGEDRSFQKNIDKLLSKLTNIPDQSGQFRAVICLIMDKKKYFFEGICRGRIIATPAGAEGFGYDPVFIPEGASKTFAEMTMSEKNSFSHRAKAIAKLVTFLNSPGINKEY